MAVERKNVVLYGAAVHAEDDTTNDNGGAIDKTTKMHFADITTTDTMSFISESTSDTSLTATVYGRDASGALVNEAETTNGRTKVPTAIDFERIHKVTLSAGGVGAIACISDTATRSDTPQSGGVDSLVLDASASASDNAYLGQVCRITSGTAQHDLREIIYYDGTTKTIYVRDWSTTTDGTSLFEISEGFLFETTATLSTATTTVRRPFIDAAAEASSGSTRNYYEKFFGWNEHASLTLSSATLAEVATGAEASVGYVLEASLDGTDSLGGSNNRLTIGDISGYSWTTDQTALAFANSGNFTNGTGQGIWMRLTLTAGQAASNSFWEITTAGQST